MCVDLLPFSTVSGNWFSAVCRKNLPTFKLPDESTLRPGALVDLCSTMKIKVRNDLQEAIRDDSCLCSMYDGWTDDYHGRPYFGLHAAYVNSETCMSEVKTLSVKVVSSHTGEELANHVSKEFDDFNTDWSTALMTEQRT